MSLLLDFELEDRAVHPVDIIEHIASINDWTFERQDADEIAISVRGAWSDYHVSFNWMEELESLHIACAFDLKVPEARRSEVRQLIGQINEQLWIGHFDIWSREDVVLFRNSHLLSGGAEVTPQQCEALLRSATESCDLYYQAFQFVVWAGKGAAEALSHVMFETVGEA
ncbi:MAG TPA: YbjN domain-containing protein [Devosiaceae bacterium]